jgi:DNA-binding transcriptional ArsR family regulator
LSLPHPTVEQLDLATILGVLGDPTRLGIVAYLAREEDKPLACAEFLGLGSKTNLSYHLARLREAGVTRTETAGTSRLISLRRGDLDRRFPGLLDSILASATKLPLPAALQQAS